VLSARRCSLILAGLAAVVLLLSLGGVASPALAAPSGLALSVLLAFGLGAVPALRGYQYTAWIVAAIVAGMLYPENVLYWGDFDLRHPWLILVIVQLVMFGMGTQMHLQDFAGVLRTPRGVAVGIFCQFSIMPTTGWLLTKIFTFPDEIAAGIILIGSCSSGLASNVMNYIAKANLALSVTVTAVATMVAPLLTPLFMKLYASTLIELDFLAMMISIVKIVVAPIGAALLADHLHRAPASGVRTARLAAAACLVLLAGIALGWSRLSAVLPAHVLTSVEILGFFAGAVVVGVVFHAAREAWPWLQRLMPYLSMFGIVYFTTVTTAAGRDDLLKVGLLLLLASILHNTAGYFFGYWLSRALGLNRTDARTMAIEVGLQNGGMASGIAGDMGKLGTVGLAAAVFSPWMNISGSILANIWGRHPVQDEPAAAAAEQISKA
jgi:BASS family bile acid:Na+ symporter